MLLFAYKIFIIILYLWCHNLLILLFTVQIKDGIELADWFFVLLYCKWFQHINICLNFKNLVGTYLFLENSKITTIKCAETMRHGYETRKKYLLYINLLKIGQSDFFGCECMTGVIFFFLQILNKQIEWEKI